MTDPRIAHLMDRMADAVQAHQMEVNDDDDVVFDVLAAMAYIIGRILVGAPDLAAQRAAHEFFLMALKNGLEMAMPKTKH